MLPAETIRRSIEERLFGPAAAGGAAVWSPAMGGLSEASVWRVAVGERSLAVRRWAAGVDLMRLTWISTTLRAAKSSGLAFIAAPITPTFRDTHGSLWEASEWLPGEPLSSLAYVSSTAREAVSGLARTHQSLLKTEPISNGVAAFGERLSQIDRLKNLPPQLHGRTCVDWPELAELAEQLPSTAKLAATQLAPFALRTWDLQPIHGDARPEHFLISEGKLTGLIDFGAMRRGTVLADIARLAGEVAVGDEARRDEVVGYYETAAERPVDRDAIAALDLAGAVLSAANWLRWLGEKQARDFDPELVRQRLRAIAARLLA